MPQQRQNSRLLGGECGKTAPQLFFHPALHLEQQGAFDVGRDDLGMDVAFAANGGRVAEPGRHLLDGIADVALRTGLLSNFSNSWSANAASTVPCQVRK